MYKTDHAAAEMARAGMLSKWEAFSKGAELETVLREVGSTENPRNTFYHEKDRLLDLANWQETVMD